MEQVTHSWEKPYQMSQDKDRVRIQLEKVLMVEKAVSVAKPQWQARTEKNAKSSNQPKHYEQIYKHHLVTDHVTDAKNPLVMGSGSASHLSCMWKST